MYNTDKTSLKADREDWGEGEGDITLKAKLAGTTAPGSSGDIGTGGSSATNHKKTKVNHEKPHQNSSGVSRTHPASTTDAPRSRRTTFQTISSTFTSTNYTPTTRAGPTTNRTPEPQRRDHARRSRSDFPVGLTPQPPIPLAAQVFL